MYAMIRRSYVESPTERRPRWADAGAIAGCAAAHGCERSEISKHATPRRARKHHKQQCNAPPADRPMLAGYCPL